MTKPTWEECHAAGMTARQAAEARGVTYSAAYQWAAKAEKKWADGYTPEVRAAHAERARKHMTKLHADPEFAAAQAERGREHMTKLHADPEFAAANAERMRKRHTDPRTDMRPSHLRDMTEKQRADYDAYRRARYSKAEALAALGLSQ